jgi:hypothetical protein
MKISPNDREDIVGSLVFLLLLALSLFLSCFL